MWQNKPFLLQGFVVAAYFCWRGFVLVRVCVDVLMPTEVRGEPQVSSSVIPGPACLGRGLPLTLALRWQRASPSHLSVCSPHMAVVTDKDDDHVLGLMWVLGI